MQSIGEPMTYAQETKSLIDFPGEYDIDGKFIQAYALGDVLSYVITTSEHTIGIISNPKILETVELPDIKYRLFFDESVEEALTRNEFEGEKLNLNTVE